MKNKTHRNAAAIWMKDILCFAIGAFFYAFAVNFFTAPSDIAPGGVTGVATVINHLTGFPIGTMILLLNIPLFILAIIFLGGKATVKTVIATAMMSVAVDLLAFIPEYKGDKVLCSLFGGLCMGVGLALVFLRGGTSGGTDILGRLLRIKWKNFSIGQMILIVDAAVVFIAAMVYRSIENALYAVIVIYVSTRVIDAAIYGAGTGKTFTIISDKSREIGETINHELERGVTVLSGSGFYSGIKKEILLCTVRQNEAAALREIIRRSDPAAFVTVSGAGEIMGEGFENVSSGI